MYPSCEHVEYAITRLISFCTRPTVAAKNAVIAPTNVTTFKASGAYSKTGDNLATINTPAVTIVAAWISAETGVGPSMASGNQVCSKNCADLPIAPMNNSKLSVVRISTSYPAKLKVFPANSGAAANTASKLIDLNM